MKKITLVMLVSTIFATLMDAAAQEETRSARPGVGIMLETPASAAQLTAQIAQEEVSPSGSPAAPTVREIYLTAYVAAKRAAQEVNPETSLHTLQDGVEAAAIYIRQELTTGQPEGQSDAMESPPVSSTVDSSARTESSDTGELSIPEEEQGVVSLPPAPATDLTTARSETVHSSIMSPDVPQPEPVEIELQRLTERVEQLERAVELLQSVSPTATRR
jgi:hypothetical protein